MIPFNKTYLTKKEIINLIQVLKNGHISAGGNFTKYAENLLNRSLKVKNTIITNSCTAALEMSAILSRINFGDEVIMPSYTFTSTANAFALRGAKIRFVDCSDKTPNIEIDEIKKFINKKTKCIVVVHYAGISCDMDPILKVARKNNILLVEDAAQAYLSKYKSKMLGTIGDLGTLSFHQTKNITSGEGGALIINNAKLVDQAKIIRDKGTNREKFQSKKILKYTWQDIGSSYAPSDLISAFLTAQLKEAHKLKNIRIKAWNRYFNNLKKLAEKELVKLPCIPKYAEHNAHIFYVTLNPKIKREKIIAYMKNKKIIAQSHYEPLHNSKAAKKYKFNTSKLKNTEYFSRSLIRLPLFNSIKNSEIDRISEVLIDLIEK